MKNTLSNTHEYKLSDEYSIEKADAAEFAIYESVYGDKTYNRFAVKHWDLRVAISLDNPFAKDQSLHWIKAGNKRIGGVLIEPNVLSRLFTIPPFANIFEIIKLLKNLLIKCSDTSKNIYAYQIPLKQANYFEMVGFWPDKSRRWMMRPTETFHISWEVTLTVATPKTDNNEEIAKLFCESFKGDIDSQYTMKQNGKESTYQDYLDEVNEYFDECTDDIFLEASTLIYDKAENKLIGACLISCLEEWPLIHTIGVNPSSRGKHLASTMIKRALTVLNNEFPVLRLYVTIGNAAEAVYHDLGFIQGVEFKRLYIPARTTFDAKE